MPDSRMLAATTALVCAAGLLTGCGSQPALGESAQAESTAPITKDTKPMDDMAQATFGGGCFWCTEAVFLEMKGVEKVTSGYSGGEIKNPTYEQICTGTTGHAEVIHIQFNPEEVSFEELLEVFFKTHDPTTLNRQGADFGTQYRSVVFYHSKEQKEAAEAIIKELNAADAYDDPIVTEVTEFDILYPAEQYHQNYYARNSGQGYCQAVVRPKVEKFRKVFADKVKKSEEAAK